VSRADNVIKALNLTRPVFHVRIVSCIIFNMEQETKTAVTPESIPDELVDPYEIINAEFAVSVDNESMESRRINLVSNLFNTECAKKLISKMKPFPGSAEKLFDKSDLDELHALLHNQTVKDLDYLLLTGELDPMEFDQYVSVMPDIRTLRAKIKEIVKRLGETNFYQRVSYLLQTSYEPKPDSYLQISEMMKIIIDLCSSQKKDCTLPLLYNDLVEFLFISLCNELFLTNINFVRERFFNKTIVKDSLINTFDFLQIYIKRYRISKSQRMQYFFAHAATLIESFYASTNFFHKFGIQVINDISEETAKSTQTHQQKINFTRINELAETKKAKSDTLEFGNIKICFLGSPDYEYSNEERKFYLFRLIMQVQNKYINIFIEKNSGELELNYSGLSLKEFLPSFAYEELKTLIYNFVYANLQAGENIDISGIIKPTQVKTEVENRALLINHQLKTIHEKLENITRIFQEISKRPDELLKLIEMEKEIEQEWKRELNKLSGRLQGIKSNQVIAAFTKLLGNPVRIRGSHMIFRAKEDKKITFPVPNHGDKDFGIGLLKKCLKKLQIPIDEFLVSI